MGPVGMSQCSAEKNVFFISFLVSCSGSQDHLGRVHHTLEAQQPWHHNAAQGNPTTQSQQHQGKVVGFSWVLGGTLGHMTVSRSTKIRWPVSQAGYTAAFQGEEGVMGGAGRAPPPSSPYPSAISQSATEGNTLRSPSPPSSDPCHHGDSNCQGYCHEPTYCRK